MWLKKKQKTKEPEPWVEISVSHSFPLMAENKMFDSEKDAYKEYQVLKKIFSWYDELTEESQIQLQNKVDDLYMVELKQNQRSTIQAANKGITMYTIPNCRFNCGEAPCCCVGDYTLYHKLMTLLGITENGEKVDSNKKFEWRMQ